MSASIIPGMSKKDFSVQELDSTDALAVQFHALAWPHLLQQALPLRATTEI